MTDSTPNIQSANSADQENAPRFVKRPRRIPNQPVVELVVRQAPIDQLQDYSVKLRQHGEPKIAKLMGFLHAVGFVAPVLVDDTMTIVNGHALVEAARRLGFKTVPVIKLSGLTPQQIKAVRVALNKLQDGSEWDREALAIEMIELEPFLLENDITVEALGFDTAEYDLLSDKARSKGDSEQDDEVPEPPRRPVSRLEDLWRLGPHRLICGNSLEPSVYVRLLDGQLARMTFSDAPYNLKVDGVISGLGKTKHREFVMGSGEMSRAEFISFLTTYMMNSAAHSVDGAVHFACMDWRHILELVTAGEAAFDKMLNLVVWEKTNAGMGSTYRSQHELIGVFRSGKAAHKNTFGLGQTGRYRTNVWRVAGANSFRSGRDKDLADHPTVKPTPLVMEAIRDVSDIGEIVLDCFCGSGTTLLAAHKTGRRGFGIELDPGYVDVAVKRWEALTGENAILDATGQTFAEVALARGDHTAEEVANEETADA